MRIKLTQDINEPNGIKVVKRAGRPAVVFEKDTVVDMSDESGRSMFAEGKGVEVQSVDASSK